MTEPAPIAWALDLLAAHNIPALGEDEDEHRGDAVIRAWRQGRDAPVPGA